MSSLYRLLVCLVSAALFAAGCVSMRMNPRATTNPKLLSDKLDIGMRTSDMETELTRSAQVAYGPYDLKVYATLFTKPYIYQMHLDSFAKRAFEERWDQPRKQEEFEKSSKANAEDIQNVDKKTCFLVRAETSDPFASAAEKWHGDVVQGSVKSKISFSDFTGFTSSAVSGYSSPCTGVSLLETKTYYLFSRACSEKAIDIRQPFTLILMPRYQDALPQITLAWLDKSGGITHLRGAKEVRDNSAN